MLLKEGQRERLLEQLDKAIENSPPSNLQFNLEVAKRALKEKNIDLQGQCLACMPLDLDTNSELLKERLEFNLHNTEWIESLLANPSHRQVLIYARDLLLSPTKPCPFKLTFDHVQGQLKTLETVPINGMEKLLSNIELLNYSKEFLLSLEPDYLFLYNTTAQQVQESLDQVTTLLEIYQSYLQDELFDSVEPFVIDELFDSEPVDPMVIEPQEPRLERFFKCFDCSLDNHVQNEKYREEDDLRFLTTLSFQSSIQQSALKALRSLLINSDLQFDNPFITECVNDPVYQKMLKMNRANICRPPSLALVAYFQTLDLEDLGSRMMSQPLEAAFCLYLKTSAEEVCPLLYKFIFSKMTSHDQDAKTICGNLYYLLMAMAGTKCSMYEMFPFQGIPKMVASFV